MTENEKNEIIIAFQSTHDAIASEQLLLASGIRAKVMPLPAQIAAGCGICLRVPQEELQQAFGILTGAGIASYKAWERHTQQ